MPIIYNNVDITEKVNMQLELIKVTLLRGSCCHLESGKFSFGGTTIFNGAFIQIVNELCYIFNPHSEFHNYYQIINVQLEAFVDLIIKESTNRVINSEQYNQETVNAIAGCKQHVIDTISSLKAN